MTSVFHGLAQAQGAWRDDLRDRIGPAMTDQLARGRCSGLAVLSLPEGSARAEAWARAGLISLTPKEVARLFAAQDESASLRENGIMIDGEKWTAVRADSKAVYVGLRGRGVVAIFCTPATDPPGPTKHKFLVLSQYTQSHQPLQAVLAAETISILVEGINNVEI
jgi:hypothetical protein